MINMIAGKKAMQYVPGAFNKAAIKSYKILNAAMSKTARG